MADASIGKAALILSVSSDKLTSGLNAATGSIKGFTGKASGMLKGGMGAAMSGAATAIKGFGTGMLIGAGMAAFNKLGEVMADPFERLDELSKVKRTAETFGMDPSEFSAISGVLKSVGSDLRDQTESLVTMSALGRNAAAGTEEAAKAFKELGLNADAFNQLNVSEQFYSIYDALAKVTDPKMRNALAGKAFGEDGMKNVLPLIGKTSAEIRAMGEQYKKTNGDLAAAEQAQKSIKDAQLAVANAWDKIVIAMAPAIELLGKVVPPIIDKLSGAFDGWGEATMPVLRGIVVGIGYVVDAFEAAWNGMKFSLSGIMMMLGEATEAIENMTGATTGWGAAMKTAGDEMGREAIKGFEGFGSNAEAARQWFDSWQQGRNDMLKKAAASPPVIPVKLDAKEVRMNYQGIAAMQRGGTEAYSIEARFRWESSMKKPAELQLAELRKANNFLSRLVGDAANKVVLEAM